MSFKSKILAITPMVCLFLYLLIGFTIGKENPSAWGWSLFIFLLVPAMPYLVGTKKIVITVSLGVTIIYVIGCLLIQFVFEKAIWHPAWIIFLLIPVIKILSLPNKAENVKKENKNKETKENEKDDDKVYLAK